MPPFSMRSNQHDFYATTTTFPMQDGRWSRPETGRRLLQLRSAAKLVFCEIEIGLVISHMAIAASAREPQFMGLRAIGRQR